MATPQALKEAGLEFEYQDEGQRLVVRDVDPGASSIRNRGGEALASFLSANRQIKALDIREAGISDNGIGHLCLVLRQTDQLEELSLSPVGHAGLEFLMGVVQRCTRLQTLRVSVVDVQTLVCAAKNVVPGDHDTSAFAGLKKAEGEEDEEEEDAPPEPEGDEDEEPEERERKKLEKLRKLLSENDYDSGDEASKSDGGALQSQAGVSATLLQLLTDFATVVRKKENLLDIECVGDVVPADLQTDLARSVKDHCEQRQRRMQSRQERGARTAFDALKDQMEELRAAVEGGSSASSAGAVALGTLPGEEGDDTTRLGMRAFIGRRLFAALGEALFECQRFKSKENEAVADWQGECAFLAMYIRKMAKEGGAGR